MPDSLQFMDCPNCAKRVRTNAERCHHCGKSLQLIGDEPWKEGGASSVFGRRRAKRGPTRKVPQDSQEHHAADLGGYDTASDDFDYDEFLESEFGQRARDAKRPWWWYVAWVVLAFLVISLLIDALQLVPQNIPNPK